MDLLFYPVMLLVLLAPAALLIRRRDPIEALAVGAALAVGGAGGVTLGRFLLFLPAGTTRSVGLIALAGAVLGLLAVTRLTAGSHGTRGPERATVPLIAAIVGAAAVTLGLEASLPHFGLAHLYYDWWEHFDLARFYRAPSTPYRVYQDGSTITSRTPLFNLVTSGALSLFGNRFTIFQVATAALGWLWVLPTTLLARRYLRRDGARFVALLVISPLVLFATVYPWSKGLVIFLVLLALDRFLALRDAAPEAAPGIGAQFGFASGLAVMAHVGYAGYLIVLTGLLLRDVAARRQRLWTVALAAITGALVVIPWYAWAVSAYGWRQGLLGYPQGAYPSAEIWFIDHVVTVVTSLIPITALMHGTTVPLVQQYFVAYLRTAVGLLGAGFLVRVAARILAPGRRPGASSATLLAFAGSGMLLTTLLLNGWGHGWAAAQALYIPAFVVLAIALLRQQPLTRGMTVLALAEDGLVLALALAYTWSSLSAGEPNALLDAANHTPFLGPDAWPAGIALLVVGVGCCVGAALRGSAAEPTVVSEVAA